MHKSPFGYVDKVKIEYTSSQGLAYVPYYSGAIHWFKGELQQMFC